nr:hypothetical protein [Actinomycetota bacterium]
PRARATVTDPDPDRLHLLSRPLAVIEKDGATQVFLWGINEEVETSAARIGGEARPGHDWPTDPHGAFRWSLRVPPAMTATAITKLPSSWRYLAIHGVGEIRLASDDFAAAPGLREWAEANQGRLVVVDSPPGFVNEFDPWGGQPEGLDIQRRLVGQFDPARVINPGRLPGGV